MGTRPADLTYAVDEIPPPAGLFVLGLQFAFLISIYLIIVVIVAKAANAGPETITQVVSFGFIAAAVGVFAQCWNGPLFGGGFLSPPVFSAIYIGPAIMAAKHGGLPAVAGLTIFAAVSEAVLSRFLLRFRVVFQPTISGFTVLVVGLQLGIVGIVQVLDIAGEGRPSYTFHLVVAIITLGTAIGFTIWGRGVVRLVCSLLGVTAGVVTGVATGLINAQNAAPVFDAAWFAVPDPSYISYSIDVSLLPAFLAAAFAATLRCIGVVTTAQKLNDAEWERPDLENLKKGVLGDAVGTLAAGVVCCPGMSVAPSLVGVSSATGATSRYIGFAAAALLLLFAFLPKIGEAMILLPPEIAGGILVFTSSFMITSGLQIMSSRTLDPRACFALSIGILLGLATQAQPAFFNSLPSPINHIAGDMLTISLLATIGLTLLFRIGIRRRETMTWQATDDAMAEFSSHFEKDAKDWKIGPRPVARAKAAVADMVAYLQDAHLLDHPVTIATSYDTIDLLVELRYRGRAPVLVEPGTGQERSNEESTITIGLQAFNGGHIADRTSVTTHADEISIRLWFGA